MTDSTNSSDLQNLVTDVENDLLDHITRNLDQSKLTVEQAQALAKEFLAMLPPHDKPDLLAKLKRLSRKHPQEVTEIYLKYATPEYQKDRDSRLHQMSVHLHKGEIDRALEVAKHHVS